DLLPDSQIAALVEYVKYLSMRGETEIRLIAAMADLSEGTLETTRAVLVDENLAPVAETWTAAEEKVILPRKKPALALAESVDKGRKLFYDKERANCIKCHGISALGDGQTSDYDDWNKPLAEIESGLVSERETLATDTSLSAADRREREAKMAQTAA